MKTSPLLKTLSTQSLTPEVSRLWADEVRRMSDTPHTFADPEKWERGILSVVRIVLAIMAAAGLLYVSGAHLVASIANASTIDPCASSDPLGVGDPSPDNPSACSAYWESVKHEHTITFYAPRGFPCNDEPCFFWYRYETSITAVPGIYAQSFLYWLGK